MKKLKNILFLAVVLNSAMVFSQNLVPNPSFEERTGCPEGYPDLDGVCNDWMSFRGSPDYFHNCSSMNGYNNNWGYQEPHSGEAYAGFITYSATGSMPSLTREHLGVELSSPLIVGEKYFISFFISAAWNPINMNIASNKTGILFTTYSYLDEFSTSPIINWSQFHTQEIISDTINWRKVSGSFIADSAYQYLVIGNFYEDLYTDTLNFPNTFINQTAYQYVDDICISTDSLFSENWTTLSIPKQFINLSISPNPASDFLQIKSDVNIQNIKIYNSLGKIIKTIDSISESEYVIDLRNVINGIYYLEINSQHKTKIVIN